MLFNNVKKNASFSLLVLSITLGAEDGLPVEIFLISQF